MAYQINVSKDAEKDLLITKCNYSVSGLDETFDINFNNPIVYLKSNPFRYQIYYRNVRVAHFITFKYLIHFIIHNEVIYILRVLPHMQKFNQRIPFLNLKLHPLNLPSSFFEI